MIAAPIGTPRPPIQYPPQNPSGLMGGMIQLLLQIMQLMMSRFQGGGFPGGGSPYGQPNFGAPPPSPFGYGGAPGGYFV